MSVIFLLKQKTAYELRVSDWSSDVCSSDPFLSNGMTRPGFSTGESSKGNEMASLVQDILDMSSFRLIIKELDLGLVDKIFVTTDGVVAEIPREAIHYDHTPQGEYVLFGDFCSIGEHELDLMLTG